MTARGQGRSHLARGVEAPSVLQEHRARVADLSHTHVSLAAVAQAVSRVLRCAADECDDEVQRTLIAAWLSGRGLPRDPLVAFVELRRHTVRRMMSDLRGDRAGAAAKWRARTRDENAWVKTQAGDQDVTLDVRATHGSTVQQEARCDARVVARAVAATQNIPSRRGPVLALVAGLTDSPGAGIEMGVSAQRARQIRDDVVRRVRDVLHAWAAGAYDFS